ncbi:hypothetical protein NDU88_001160 [Pleurodeles waltl]|uniref:Uncharacterized protein n=1 Tax=Pleurodeles waltl TaxID=8319 RepID=A0AAV7US06_PLEWA|nr:hypothetical protein NDU88_001160 [Pleurodeles waltl]
MNPPTRDPGRAVEDPGILRSPRTTTPKVPGQALESDDRQGNRKAESSKRGTPLPPSRRKMAFHKYMPKFPEHSPAPFTCSLSTCLHALASVPTMQRGDSDNNGASISEWRIQGNLHTGGILSCSFNGTILPVHC